MTFFVAGSGRSFITLEISNPHARPFPLNEPHSAVLGIYGMACFFCFWFGYRYAYRYVDMIWVGMNIDILDCGGCGEGSPRCLPI